MLNIVFEDLFNLSDFQRLQDMFAKSWGVAMLLTRPDGAAITQPSNFTYFCSEFIRKNEKGFRNCQNSDAELGRYNPSGPIIHKCLSAGLWGAGASITVGGRHIANWLIGQVRNEAQSEEEIMEYARAIGIDEAAFREAFLQVPVMLQEKFEQIAHTLFALANQISNIAYQNIQQARFISERKQAEKALRESEIKYRRLHESMTEAFVRVDMTGRIQESNRAYQSMMGYSEDELLHLTYSDITPEKWHALEKNIIEEQILVPGYSKVYEKEYQRKDGSVFPVELSTFLIRDDAGNPTDLWAIVHDITERKKMEKELRTAKDYLRTVFNNVYDAIMIHDLDGKVIDVNDKMLEMYRVSREEAIGLNVLRDYSVTDESMEESLSNWNKVMSGEHIFTEWKARRPKDGSVFDVEVFLSKLSLSDGDYILSNVRDISKRKQAEQALQNSEEILHRVFKTTPVGLCIMTDRVFQSVNEAWLNICGYSESDLIGNTPRLLYENEEEYERVGRELFTDLPIRGLASVQTTHRRKDGAIRDVILAASPLLQENRSLGAIVTVEDITERKYAEAVLKESEEKYNQFFKTSRDCVLITKDNSLIDINDAAVELLGYSSREELLQVKVPDLYAELEEWIKHINIISECGYCKEYPVNLRRKDGSIRHTLVTSAARYDKNGNLIGFQGTVRDVTEQRLNEEELKKYREKLEIMVAERTKELEEKTNNLQELNTTLNVLLEKRDQDKQNLEENFVANIGSMVLPYLEKMRKNNLDAQQQFCLDTVEKNLDEIVSPLLKNIQQFKLTPREIQIACLIKDGKTTKQIADVLGIAAGSISTHRKNIRKKLSLDRDSNLQSSLLFLEK